MIIQKLTSYDNGYTPGILSIYPKGIDDYSTLYEAKNNSSTKSTQYLPVNGQLLIVESTADFPSQGILKLKAPGYDGLSSELIYYNKKTANSFSELIRGFCSSKLNYWNSGTIVEAGVMAEHHNTIRDAVLNIEAYIGISDSTDETTLNGILKSQENKLLAPKSLFRGYPKFGTAPLTVNFHSFTNSNTARYFWDFGDGGFSFEKNPVHTYQTEGAFTVQLRTITSLGAQGYTTKTNYINIQNDYATPFVYTTPATGQSKQTSPLSPTIFQFVDQTRAEIVSRVWQFGDGTSIFQEDPQIHIVEHYYEQPGSYDASVLIELSGQRIIRVYLDETIKVE
jgi:PKD repeat protein